MSKITEILLQKIIEKSAVIDAWFSRKFQENSPLIYNSVDLRHADFKIAPVDTNCFPAGFNNLSEVSKNLAKKTVDDFLNKNFPNVKKILITPENHTQNLRYLENVKNLQKILSDKREVLIGSLIEDLKEVAKIDLENGQFIELHPLTKKDNKIAVVDFIPDLIVMNNDLTSGVAQILQNIAIPIVPSVELGWYQRTKSRHFTIYNQLAAEISALIDLDPWLISTINDVCHDINFKDQIGIEPLAKAVDDLIEKTAEKYRQYGIDEQPYCYVKADSGTYGIAVWSVMSGDEVLHINKKERNKMNMLKGSVQNTSVIIQEGVKTVDKINSEIAEPMIYLMNGEVVGNLFRVNNSRDEKISLNSTGASFFDLTNLSENQIQLGADKNNITKIYALIARLAALAAAVEQQQMLGVK
ncbi:MAG: glutamate--cysteine ligase [Proteobacteria bacterium]|nr:glutamate--cysteine ligase [Pseudomonadota bacterium]